MNKPFEPQVKAFKKSRRRYPKGVFNTPCLVKFNCGIYAKTAGKIFSYHLETIRKTITNYFSRQVKPLIRAYPNTSYTSKPFDIRRGRGKGSVEGWYQYIKINKVLFEFQCNDMKDLIDITRIINSKLPIKISYINKDNTITDKK